MGKFSLCYRFQEQTASDTSHVVGTEKKLTAITIHVVRPKTNIDNDI